MKRLSLIAATVAAVLLMGSVAEARIPSIPLRVSSRGPKFRPVTIDSCYQALVHINQGLVVHTNCTTLPNPVVFGSGALIYTACTDDGGTDIPANWIGTNGNDALNQVIPSDIISTNDGNDTITMTGVNDVQPSGVICGMKADGKGDTQRIVDPDNTSVVCLEDVHPPTNPGWGYTRNQVNLACSAAVHYTINTYGRIIPCQGCTIRLCHEEHPNFYSASDYAMCKGYPGGSYFWHWYRYRTDNCSDGVCNYNSKSKDWYRYNGHTIYFFEEWSTASCYLPGPHVCKVPGSGH